MGAQIEAWRLRFLVGLDFRFILTFEGDFDFPLTLTGFVDPAYFVELERFLYYVAFQTELL